ncbi:endonuclease MutS2, partial [bacterium]
MLKNKPFSSNLKLNFLDYHAERPILLRIKRKMTEPAKKILKSATEHALGVLEFGRIRKLVKEACDSELGKEKAEELYPLDSAEQVRNRLELVSEIIRALEEAGQPDLSGIADVRQQITLVTKEGVLSADDLWKIGCIADLSNRLSHYSKKGCNDKPHLGEVLGSLFEIPGIAGRITEYIIPPGELSEDATPLLTDLRKRKAVTHEKLQAKLESYIGNPKYENILQDEFVTLRHGRFVLPVKIERKQEIQGVIHDRSASGATLFIEPLPIVELNNEMRELELAEEAERERIFRLLSELVAAHAESLKANLEILGRLDFLVACARVARRFDSTCPEYGKSEDFILEKARHPMLIIEGEENEDFEVVPLDIELRDSSRALVVTGPNMGGKTVALKTCGLLAAMTQSGLPIPAGENSKIPHLSGIFADIGDEQSIDDSLSSFAAHVNRWQEAVLGADENSLVLIDELGSATDPEEGTPLSRALLEELIEKHSYLIVTTHLGGLKALAVATDGVENGAMEFDQDELRPTYRLKTGIPGRSWAFQISRRLGLDERILERGEKLIGESGSHIDRLIADLQRKMREAESLRANVKSELKALKQEKETLNALIKANEEKASRVEELRKRYEDDRLEMLEREMAIERRKLNEEIRKIRRQEEAAESARKAVRERLDEIKKI